jgi:hypothetical protein
MTLQFRTLEDIQDIIKEYQGIVMRPTVHLSHPTLYRKRDLGDGEMAIKGVRIKDWFFSEDQKWVLPHDQMGLSFSSTFSNLKKVYKLKGRHNAGKAIHVYWVLEDSDIPPGLKFEADREKKGHYFLIVTEKMLLSQLITKLKMLAHRMTIIRDAGKAL